MAHLGAVELLGHAHWLVLCTPAPPVGGAGPAVSVSGSEDRMAYAVPSDMPLWGPVRSQGLEVVAPHRAGGSRPVIKRRGPGALMVWQLRPIGQRVRQGPQ